MITKFERKVIAGLTAFLMCLSMVFAVPVSVNAEAEQTQDEAVSDAKKEEAVSDVQVQDETVNDAQQDVTTGDEVDEEGDKTAGDIQKLPEMSAESTDAMLNATTQENVAGSITLKKDGTGESGSVMLQEDQTSVRYRLNVEEDGRYYFGATGDFGMYINLSLKEKTEDGELYVDMVRSQAELRKEGTYYMEISEYSTGDQRTIKWNAGKVKDIKPGEFDVELNKNNPLVYYRLTVDETGTYYTRSLSGASFEIRDAQTGDSVLSSSFCKLKKENIYEVKVGIYSQETVSGKWSIVKGIEKQVECGKSYINETNGVYYKFVPKTTGSYTAEGYFYNEEWGFLNYSEKFLSGNTYYFVPRGRYFCIEQREDIEVEEVKVEVGEKYTQDMNSEKSIVYEFTPEETARYNFHSEQNVRMNIITYVGLTGGIGVLEGKVDYSLAMEAGAPCRIELYKQDAEEVTWFIEKATTKTATVGTEYVSAKGSINAYDFTPSKSAEYRITFKENGIFSVWNDIWREMKKCQSEETNGGEIVLSLEQGKTYHFAVAAMEKDIQWKIEEAKAVNGFIYRNLADNTIEILKYTGTESNVTIPDKIDNKVVKSIGAESFANNETVVGVTIPAQVTDMQYGAFASCTNLKKVTFAQGIQLKKIEETVFEECRKLEQINIPESVMQIEKNAFYYCISLNNITFGKKLSVIGKSAFEGCSSLKQIEMSDSVKSIGEKAFGHCVSLEHVTIGNELSYIAKNAFEHCGLTEITWGDRIEKIGETAFSGNKNLTTVSIPDTVTEIEYGAFGGCTNLSEIDIPDSVEAIGSYAFEGEDLWAVGGNTAWYETQTDGDVYAGKVYYKYKGTIAEGGTVNLKAGTKGIAGSAFIDQRNLTGIEIPDSVTNIGDYAFVGCEKLNKVTVPASVTKIGEKALGYLTSGKGGKAYKLEGFTIRGVAGSAAEKYARENEFNFEAYTPEYIRGDVDVDGKVGIGDVRMTLRSICKKAELNGTQKLAADVEKDGVVDIKDLRKILRYVCGKIEYL